MDLFCGGGGYNDDDDDDEINAALILNLNESIKKSCCPHWLSAFPFFELTAYDVIVNIFM